MQSESAEPICIYEKQVGFASGKFKKPVTLAKKSSLGAQLDEQLTPKADYAKTELVFVFDSQS